MVIARALGAWTADPEAVRIREVGPRDGFQNEPEMIATDDKVRLVEMLARTGVRRLEVTSFVRADVSRSWPTAREVLERAEIPDEVSVSVLVPNMRGLEAALEVREKIDEVNVFLSASETHNRHNVNRSVEESLAGLEQVLARATEEGLRCEGVISTSFGCPYEGYVPVERVFEIARRLAAAGAVEIGFGDTTGMANPLQVGEFFRRAAEELGGGRAAPPTSTTPAARRSPTCWRRSRPGVDSFESSFGELGGCPCPARRDRQRRQRGPGLDAARDGDRDRHRPRQAAGGRARRPGGARPPARLPHPRRRPGRVARRARPLQGEPPR